MIQHSGQHANMSPLGELVVNWHLTEACNYSCRYCYSKWHSNSTSKELIHNADASTAVLAEIYRYFSPHKRQNQARLGMTWESLRLNIAGGEPLLYSQEIVRIAAKAKEFGFTVSVITNGSCLTQPMMAVLAPKLSVLGLSLDSAIHLTNLEIGRADRHSRVLNLDELASAVQSGRILNPDMRLKINTVVNALNFSEDMSCVIQKLAPDKWKVLRMLPTVTSDLEIADHEFVEFIDRHKAFGKIITAEDNSNMVESYIMIDPSGRFFQNSPTGSGYRYSDPILQVGVETAFRQVTWFPAKFQARYAVAGSESMA
ncbi:MAG: viperin family antiviral radical SAM protein [Betaproteobacteria bacterium]